MEEVKEEKYSGDIISEDGRNMKNALARQNKGRGIVSQIMSILEEICFGRYFFEVAGILRNSLLISTLLTNSEAWYNITNEKVDESLMRKVLEYPISTEFSLLHSQ